MNEHWVLYLTAWAGLLTALVTILVGVLAVNVVHQYLQGRKIINDTKSKLSDLEQKYNLSKLRTPDEILAKAREEVGVRLESALARIEAYHESYQRQFEQMPTRDSILLEIKEQYRPPSEIEQQILPKLLLALYEIKTLTNEERNAIRSHLTEATTGTPSAVAG
jgi:hypothetical protein